MWNVVEELLEIGARAEDDRPAWISVVVDIWTEVCARWTNGCAMQPGNWGEFERTGVLLLARREAPFFSVENCLKLNEACIF
jgi:hypothetical protein